MEDGKYLQLPEGFKIYYEESGEGTPAVFLHGWNSSHEVFGQVISQLKGCRCISYDCRGHGKSTAPINGTTLDALAKDLHELLVHCGLEGVILAGWSMGAAVIWRYVRRYGCERLAHLVLIDMSPKVMNDEGWKLGLWKGEYTVENYIHDMTIGFTDFSRFAVDGTWEKYNLETKASPPATAENHNYFVLLSLWHSMMVTDCREDLSKILVETDIFYGSPGDKYLPETADYLAQHIPAGTRLVPFYGCGHDLIWQDAPKFLSEMQRVIEKFKGRKPYDKE